MSQISGELRDRLVERMKAYLQAPPGANGKTPIQLHKERDAKREAVIESKLGPLVSGFLSGGTDLSAFKSSIDSINKSHNHWGFGGIKGQMFFNIIYNVADDLDECAQELRSALALPDSDLIASSRMKTFTSYVNRLRDQWSNTGNSMHGAPKLGSVPFFLSYFWQVQDCQAWPVCYTSTTQVLTDLNLWHSTGHPADDYMSFKVVHDELLSIFSQDLGKDLTRYDADHMIIFDPENPYDIPGIDYKPPSDKPGKNPVVTRKMPPSDTLPSSYVPPIVGILPQMATNNPDLVAAAKRSGASLDSAFEKSINAAFTVMGYETLLLGQGKGRVPDGLATAYDYGYAIIWDGKVRADGYNMGTDDRTIREYISTQSQALKKRGYLKNIYYVIISSSFSNDFEESVLAIKMETNVSEVVLMQADALVAIVEARLRSPLQVTLGPDGLQRLLSSSGVLTSGIVEQMLQ